MQNAAQGQTALSYSSITPLKTKQQLGGLAVPGGWISAGGGRITLTAPGMAEWLDLGTEMWQHEEGCREHEKGLRALFLPPSPEESRVRNCFQTAGINLFLCCFFPYIVCIFSPPSACFSLVGVRYTATGLRSKSWLSEMLWCPAQLLEWYSSKTSWLKIQNCVYFKFKMEALH